VRDMSAHRFAVGDAVRTIVSNPTGHTRLPRYARGRRGRIESLRREQALPDVTVQEGRRGERIPVYGVAFAMEELWGADAEDGAELVMELWESYLVPDDEDGALR
jgi:hypothetical protein